MNKLREKKNWIFRMRCVVDKDIFLENCTEEQARENPWAFSKDELEIDMRDWEIISVEENK
jgi:hypothetical protein